MSGFINKPPQLYVHTFLSNSFPGALIMSGANVEVFNGNHGLNHELDWRMCQRRYWGVVAEVKAWLLRIYDICSEFLLFAQN